jgi:DNA modification methylase
METLDAVSFAEYAVSRQITPMFVVGDALEVLSSMPSESVDCSMTSPPYWGQRAYEGGGIGLERHPEEYIEGLLAVFAQLHRVLKPTGSFWLNMGDAYLDKRLLGLPWRVAIALCDRQGWVLRNDVVWHKVKGGPDNSTDKLRNVHETVFH